MRWLILSLIVLSLAAPSAMGGGLVAERLVPAGTAAGYITAERPDTPGPWLLSARLFTGLSRDPLRLVVGATQQRYLDTLVSGQASLSIGLWRFLEAGVALPVTLYQAGPDAGLAGAALGDVRLLLKARLLSLPHVGLGALLAVSLPSGNSEALAGTGAVAFSPRLLFEARGRRVRAGLNAGVTVRQAGGLADMRVSHELTYSAGLGLRPHRVLELLGEVYGSTALSAPFSERDQSPVEMVGAAALRAGPVVVTLGAGAGVVNGYGAPAWRVFLGLGYEQPPRRQAVAFRQRRRPGPAPAPKPIELAPPEIIEDPATVYLGNAEISITATEVVPRDAIFFGPDEAEVPDRSYQVLDALAELLQDHPELGLISIEAHADAVGTAGHNRRLSQRRGEAVRRALIARGLDPKRLAVVAYGARKPVASNDDREGRSRNRRVVFYHDWHDAALQTASRPSHLD